MCPGAQGPSVILSFFFQAEDGIRALYVTGVQTCALPIFLDRGVHALADKDLPGPRLAAEAGRQVRHAPDRGVVRAAFEADLAERGMPLSNADARSEERRVGKECRRRWSPDDLRTKVPRGR